MPIEIERKFLVAGNTWREQVRSRELLRQGYLDSAELCSVRVRAAGEHAWLNIKARRPGMSRLEFEYPIPLSDADAMLDELCKGPLIEKYRHEIPAGGAHVWQVDEFLGLNHGLIVAEIELSNEAEEFARPSWLGEEVTHDERYYNHNLAQRPYAEWK